jgi:hypothetical protein
MQGHPHEHPPKSDLRDMHLDPLLSLFSRPPCLSHRFVAVCVHVCLQLLDSCGLTCACDIQRRHKHASPPPQPVTLPIPNHTPHILQHVSNVSQAMNDKIRLEPLPEEDVAEKASIACLSPSATDRSLKSPLTPFLLPPLHSAASPTLPQHPSPQHPMRRAVLRHQICSKQGPNTRYEKWTLHRASHSPF